MRWTSKDSKEARKEGWDIWEKGIGSYKGPYALEKLDEDTTFQSDEEAWLFVARFPTPLHVKALRWLKINNKAEYDRIRWAQLMNRTQK